ncbi:two-partner secretion domain-containing protein [Atopomonas sediminilitoris]|uniref:two-partner secretion domain-containing protein n=1 Tax=Atopomonas sediminilitoris TaxID=2919919 RepID=UPI002342EFDD|nr:filamentous hemagglutinin N-terminal domain-containing protein [Atopomonas sediminilitoris]
MDAYSPINRAIARLLIVVMTFDPLVSVAAEITVDNSAGGNTALGNAGNGVPLVNIATPNGNGLSHNRFGEFNVGSQGLILNNATDKLQSTQLGGYVLGNPNLKGNAANLILNEVNGGNPSQLKGYTEVAGKSAAVVIANPHGIACDGCGFINTPRVTLSTGKPQIEAGRLTGYDVDGGSIAVQGAGLNASNVSQFDLITRSAEINADIHAQQLNIIAGRNRVDANSLQAIQKASDGNAPALAIDSSALGGMYAGAIRLVGTEAGVGVKLAGDMAASAGDIQIDAKGQLRLSQVAANRDIKLKAQDINLDGKAYAGRSVDAQAAQTLSLVQGKSLAARERIDLTGGQLINQGLIEAGVNGDNTRNQVGDVQLSGDSLRNDGKVLASRDLGVTVNRVLDNRAGALSSKANTRITASTVNNSDEGLVLSTGNVAVETAELDNRAGLIASAQELKINARTALNNQGGEISSEAAAIVVAGEKIDNRAGLITADSSLRVTTKALDNRAEGTLSSRGSLTVRDAAVDNQGGSIVATQRLELAGKSLDNRGGAVSGKTDAFIEVADVLDNRGSGSVLTDGQLKLVAGELRNGSGGQLAAKGDVTVRAGSLSQQGGELLSQRRLTIAADQVDNRNGGLIAATQGVDVNVSQSLLNSGGEISTQGQANLLVQSSVGQPAALLDNSNGGLIVGDQGLLLTVQRLLNHAKGMLSGRDRLVMSGESLDNSNDGTLSSREALSIELTGALHNQAGGALVSGGNLAVNAASLDNSATGLLSAAGNLILNRAALNNQGGKLVSDGQLTVTNTSLDNSKGGTISAKQALSIGTGELNNHTEGLITSGAGLQVTAGQINNHTRGAIQSQGQAQVTAAGLDQHTAGTLSSAATLNLDLQGGVLNNRDKGLLATPGALLLSNLGRVDNSAGGEISSAQSFLLKTTQLDNSGGRIISGQELQLQVTEKLLNNLKGALSAAKLKVVANSLDNSGAGVLVSKGDLSVTLGGKLNNHDQGLISAGQALTVVSGSVDNSQQGLLASNGVLQLTTGAANNQGGTLASQATLTATTADLDNRGGVISSQQAQTLSAAAVNNRDQGLITSAADLTINAASLDSSNAGELSAKGDLRLTIARLIQKQGRLIGEAGVRIDLQGGDLDNQGGLLSAKGPLTLENLAKLDNRGGELSSSQGYSLLAKEVDNGDQGKLISAGSLDLDVGSGKLRNSGGGLISGWQGLKVKGGSLDNSGLGTLSSRDGNLKVELSGALNNSGEGALVSQGKLTVDAASLNNSTKGILSSAGDLGITLTGTLNNSAGLIDSQSALTAKAGAVDNRAGQIGSENAASITAASLDNSAGQLSSNAAFALTLVGDLLNRQKAKLASAGPLVLKAKTIDNQGGSLISQSLLQLTATSLNNSSGGTLAARNALNIGVDGALINSADGLIHSQLGAIDLRAQSLSNNSGTLSAQHNLTVNLGDELVNQSGRIESLSGNVDLQKSSSVDNSGGVLSSLKGWLKVVSRGLFDNDTGTTQAQALTVNAKGLNNRGGHLSALVGDTTIDLGAASLNNQGGGLYAQQSLQVIAGDFNNQGAAQGQGGKVAAQRIDFGLAGALRNSFGILESSSDLSLNAGSIDNQHGRLRALGASGITQIDGGFLDNRNGTIETANADLALNVASLQSSGGRILHTGSGSFGLSAAQVMGAGGDLGTNGLLSLSADSWTNSGVLQAGRLVLNIGNFTQTASGQLLVGQSLTGTGGTWINHGLLASDGILDLNLTGAYSGNGQLTSLGDLSLKAASVDLSSSARIAGGDQTLVSANGLLNNQGKVTSAGDLKVIASTLHNYGTLGSAQKLSLHAPTLLNERSLVFSGSDMALHVNDFTNRYADVFSLGDLSIDRDGQGGLANSIINSSASLQSDGSIRLAASTIQNVRTLLNTNNQGIYTAKIYEVACIEGVNAGDCKGGKRNRIWEILQRDKLEVTEASSASSITAGGDLSLTGGTLLNQSSTIATGGSLQGRLTSLTNSGIETGETETVRVFRTPRTRNPSYWFSASSDFTRKYWHQSSGYNPNNLGGLAADMSRFIASTETELPQFGRIQTLAAGDQRYAAIIQAAGTVDISTQNNFDIRVVRPSYTYISGGQKVGNSKVDGSGLSTSISLNAQLPPDLRQQQVNPLSLPSFSLPQGQNGLFRLNAQAAQGVSASNTQAATNGNTLSFSAVTVGAGPVAQGSAIAVGRTWQLQDGISPGSAPFDTASILLPTVQGLPSSQQPSRSHRYLIETNPELTNLKQFLGSDYMLGHLGYTPDNAQKRLGDGLYEQRLIREAIVARTGQRFLAGLTSDEAMFRHLMDNAIASKQALQLAVGVTLTAEQVAALTHDIVWLEEYEVNGEKVLVPVLYLAQAEGRLAPNGALIQGRDVKLVSGGELNNQGTLRASRNLDISAGNINNAGLMQANERLSLLATDSIHNNRGGIIAGRDVSAIALTGDILNERSVTTHEAAQRGYTHRGDFVDNAARIEAANDLTLAAGRDLQNIGGVLQAGRDINLEAGRDLMIVSAREHDLTARQARKSSSRIERVTQYASEVSAGRDVALSAERDLAVIASRVNATQDLSLAAGGDVLISSAANESHDEYHRRGGGKRVDIERSQVTQQGAELSAGGDLLMSAKGDMALVASQLKADDEAYLYAGGELALLAGQDSSYSLYDMKKKGSWGSKKSQRDEVTKVTNVGSQIITGGDLTLVSEGDQTYQAARLESGNDLTLQSGGAITFEGVKDLEQESHEKSKSSWAWNSMKGKGNTDETLRQSQLVAQGDIVIQAVEGLQIDIKEVNQQTVSQTINAMVSADPDLAWLKDMQQRGDVDWRRVKEIHDSYKYSHSGLGGPAMMIIAIIVAYLTAGAASGLVASTATTAGASTAATAASGAWAAGTGASLTGIGWANAAVTAGLTGMAGNAAVSTINNRGNLGAVLKDVTSKEAMRGYVVSGVTAGLTTGVFNELTGTTSTQGNPAVANSGKTVPAGGLSSLEGVGRFAGNQLLQNGTSTVLDRALGGDSTLSDALRSSLANTFAAAGFNWVGDQTAPGEWDIKDGSLGKIGLHAVMGGLAAEAAGGDFKTGALAAGVNEALVGALSAQYEKLGVEDKKSLLVMNSQVIGVLTAAAQGGDEKALQTGSWVASTATSYNYLDHSDARDFAKEMEICKSEADCRVAWKQGGYDEISLENLDGALKVGGVAFARWKMGDIAAGLDVLTKLNCTTSFCETQKLTLMERAFDAYERASFVAGEFEPVLSMLSMAAGMGRLPGRAPGSVVAVGSASVQRAVDYFKSAKAVGAKETVTVAGEATSVNAQAALRAKLSGLQKAQQTAAVTKTLPDGRVRYYTQEVPARTEGATRGASFVTEHNPQTGQTRQWMESYDQSGTVIRVHPKSINGQPVSAQHYPPTGAELESWK